MSLFSGKHRITAVADIGSGSVGFSILATSPEKAKILAAERSILSLESRTREQIQSGVLRMLQEAGTEVLKKYSESPQGKQYGPPKEVYAIMRTPWTNAATGHAHREFDSETGISKETITEVAQSIYEENKDLDKANMLETAVVRVELNGYPTSSPVGKRARTLDVTTFMSDCDASMHEGVRGALESLLPGRNINVRSGSRTYLLVVEELLQHPESYVVFNMVSEATSVMAVREGIITHHATINEGVRTIIRRIAGAKGTPEETIGLMRMVVAGSCSGEECDRLNEALAKVEPDLVRVFGEGMAALMGKQRLPANLVLFGHPDIAQWLSKLFARIDFAQFTIPLQPFNVYLATPEKIMDTLRLESSVEVDSGVLAANAFVNMQVVDS